VLINIADLVRVYFDIPPSQTLRYVQEEYGHLFEKGKRCEADIVFIGVGKLRKKPRYVYFVEPVAYDDESVFWYDKMGRMARIDFENFQNKIIQVHIDFEFDSHFLGIIMEYLISFKLLKHGACFCHASAIEYKGTRILFPAWRHAGKTNLMLHFLELGARYVADDWVILYKDGSVLPLPKRLHLLYYNFMTYPSLVKGLEPEARAMINFTQKAMEGEYDLDWDVVDAIRQRIRYRRPIYELGAEADYDKAQVGMIFLLQKEVTDRNVLEVKRVTAEVMSVLTQPILYFEQMHFHSAYAAHKIRSGKPVPYLEKRNTMIADVLQESYKKIPFLYEVSFTAGTDVKKIADLIVKHIRKVSRV